MKEGNDETKWSDVPLVMWKDRGHEHMEGRKEDNCIVYGPNKKISDLDAVGVKHIYTWPAE
jgi:hypothetical protein